MLTMISIGGGLALAGSILAYFGGRKYRHATFDEEVYRNLFIDRNLYDRLAVRLRQHNQRAAQACGFTGPVEAGLPALPAPPTTDE
ncbi:MAG TPA: hypothetical protein VGQ83_21030 [Polyangia bacterium]|jgi:membrane protein DedA with SNARE-associated domain